MTTSSSITAVIPARGGSKQIPRKNIREICGVPLIAWNIDAARRARLIDEVIVSTDDPGIAEIARRYGAEVVMRPAELAGDFVPSEEALIHVVESLDADAQPDIVAFLQCTSPTTLPDDIDGTICAVASGRNDCAVTGIPFHYFVWQENGEGSMSGVNHDESRRLMRQERTPEFLEIGACYVMRTAGLLEHRRRFFGRVGMHIISPKRAIEIDDEDDWAVAESWLERQVESGERQAPEACAAR
jgi:CMP-N-acetylneuraminic acid synthetase